MFQQLIQNAPNPISRKHVAGIARIFVVMGMVLSASGVYSGERGDVRASTRTDSNPSLQLALHAEPVFDPVQPSLVGHGDFITYTLTITNIGSEIQTQVMVTDAVPAGTSTVASSMRPEPTHVPSATSGPVVWQISALAPGQVFTAVYTVRVSNYVTVTAIVNKAYASSAETQVVQSNTIVHPFGFTETAQLAIRLNSDPPMFNAGGFHCTVDIGRQIRYTVVVTNVGPLLADTLIINSKVPPGTNFIAGSLYPPATQSDDQSFTWKASQLTVSKTFTATFKVRVANYNETAIRTVASVESAQTAMITSNTVLHVYPSLLLLTPTPPGTTAVPATLPPTYCPAQIFYFPVVRTP